MPKKSLRNIKTAQTIQFAAGPRGTRMAAEWLRLMGWSLEAALFILVRRA